MQKDNNLNNWTRSPGGKYFLTANISDPNNVSWIRDPNGAYHINDINFDLEKVIKFCIPDRETIDSSWIDDGDGWFKIFLYFDIAYKVNISQSEIQNTINYLENLGLKFHRSEKDEIVFYDPEKAK